MKEIKAMTDQTNVKTLATKIAMLEEMIGDPKKLNKAVYDVITGSDMNNDECLSKVEFQVRFF